MELRGISYCGMEKIHLAQDRDQWTALENRVMNLQVLKNVVKFFST
jgi:hypothetical protein